MRLDPVALQAYLRTTAQGGRDVVAAGAFVVTIDPTWDLRFVNYAVSTADADAAGVAASEERVRRVMVRRRRLPRVEAVTGAVPGIEAALLHAGWELESRLPIMVCTPADLRPVEVPDGAELVEVDARSAPDVVRAFLRTPREAFGEDPDRVTDAEVARFAAAGRLGVLARQDGEPAAGGSLSPIADGLTEVAGIGTRAPFRRRGLAGAVTAALARMAFARGARAAFLSPGDEGAGRVYARAGFAVDGEVLALVAPEVGSEHAPR
jgi:ribosomal protein S18 acetylase RimI-like enzyme